MNNYYFNNSEWVFNHKIIVIGEHAFRNLQDNLLCETKSGSWNDHWLSTEAANLNEASEHFKNTWCM